ncbi:MAG: uracil-DNA glycosylase [Rhizobacter sp.]|nr:uracil-DNA glycosylase [Rhizobacter sp.]
MTADDLAAAFDTLPPAWAAALPGWTAERRAEVVDRVRAASADRPIAPADPFRALRLVAPQDVRAVILGQDPYPKPGQADGLAFSAGQGRPASLRRVFQVLAADRTGFVPPAVWKLDAWARQGVLLLNPTLTIEVGRIGSHMACGWQALTSEIVQQLSLRDEPPVFMLWGAKAQAFFDAACAPGVKLTAYRTRHPSNDMRRDFMREGSQFLLTAHLVDWWAL